MQRRAGRARGWPAWQRRDTRRICTYSLSEEAAVVLPPWMRGWRTETTVKACVLALLDGRYGIERGGRGSEKEKGGDVLRRPTGSAVGRPMEVRGRRTGGGLDLRARTDARAASGACRRVGVVEGQKSAWHGLTRRPGCEPHEERSGSCSRGV